MNRHAFLDVLRRGLNGFPQAQTDEIVADYTAHFAEGAAAGRSEDDVAAALGDPQRLAREWRTEIGLRRWEQARTPTNFLAVLFGFIGLVMVDFVFMLPMLILFILFAMVAALIAFGLCIGGVASMVEAIGATYPVARLLRGVGLLGFGIGGGAVLMMTTDWVMHAIGRFARLHYSLLKRADD